MLFERIDRKYQQLRSYCARSPADDSENLDFVAPLEEHRF